MANKTVKKAIALLLAICAVSAIFCACEAEPEDTSIWAQKKLPYNYPLDSYVVLGEYIGVTDVSVELDYDFEARRNARIAEIFKDLVTYDKADTALSGDKAVLECEVLLGTEVCDFLPAGDYEIVIGALTRLNVLSDSYTEKLLADAIQRSINGESYFNVPSFYSDVRYRGKTLKVRTKLKEIYRPDFSALNDESVSADGVYESLEALYDAVEIDIYTEDAEIAEYAKKRILWDKAVADSTFFSPLPNDELSRCETEYIDYYKEIAEYNGISYEEYLSSVHMTEEQILSDARAYAEEKVKNELCAFAIAKEEGLIPSQTQCQMLGHELAHKLGYSGYDELISYNSEESVYVYIIWETAVSFILEHAKVPVYE